MRTDGCPVPGSEEAPPGRGAGATSWLQQRLEALDLRRRTPSGMVLSGAGERIQDPELWEQLSVSCPHPRSAKKSHQAPAPHCWLGEGAGTQPCAAAGSAALSRGRIGVSSARACCSEHLLGETSSKTRVGPKAAARRPSRALAAVAESPRLCRQCPAPDFPGAANSAQLWVLVFCWVCFLLFFFSPLHFFALSASQL